jgi:type IV secretion system protein VirB9
MRLGHLPLAAILLATAAAADIRPQPGPGDPRIQTVMYDPNQVVQLQGTPGYQMTIQLSPDELVQNVSIGDSGTWQVNINHAGDHLFLKPTQAGAPTNMTVITNVRVYNFELVSLALPTPEMAYTIQFKYPAEAPALQKGLPKDRAAIRRASRYRIGGDRALRPTSVSDDGEHTYVTWPADHPIPATFQIGDDGAERLVNGGMRGDEFVVDGIAPRLVFRIDGRFAYAQKQEPRRHP